MGARLRRLAAMIATLALAAVGVAGVASPASAGRAPQLLVSVTPDAPASTDTVTLHASVHNFMDGDCSDLNLPTVTYAITGEPSGSLTEYSLEAGTATFALVLGPFAAGGERTVTVHAIDGCAGPFELTATATFTVTEPDPDPDPEEDPPAVTYARDTVAGHAGHFSADATDPGDFVVFEGIVVDLMAENAGPDAEPVASTTTDPAGAYVIGAPVSTQDEADRGYKLRFTYPYGAVVYFDAAAGFGNPSTTSWDDATVGGPQTWTDADYSAYNLLPSETAPGATAISGILWSVTDGIATPAPAGVVIRLVDLAENSGSTAMRIGADGRYRFEIAAPSEAGYVIMADPIGYRAYYGAAAASTHTSVEDVDDADVFLPGAWDETADFDIYLDYDSAPSHSDWERVCVRESDTRLVAMPSATWNVSCDTEAALWEVDTTHHSDGIATFGRVVLGIGATQWYDVTADTMDVAVGDGSERATLTDTTVLVDGRRVIVTVVRTISGSTTRWDVDIADADTSEPVDVPFLFSGHLGSGHGTTDWTVVDEHAAVSTDDALSRGDGDPIMVHWKSGGTEFPGDGQEGFWMVAQGSLTYILGAVDYTGCDDGGFAAGAAAIAADLPDRFGDDLVLTGGTCPLAWPDSSLTRELVAGTAYDETFSPTDDPAFWDWSVGGTIAVDDLPVGLEAEYLDQNVPGQRPSVRISGVPTDLGTGTYTLTASDRIHVPQSAELAIVITAPDCDPDAGQPSLRYDVQDSGVGWQGLCRWDGTLEDASLFERENAFDGLGTIRVDGLPVHPDESYRYENAISAHAYDLVDRDFELVDGRLVDVHIQWAVVGTMAFWVVEAEDPDTGDAVDVPVSIAGNLGSDEHTRWYGESAARVSTDYGVWTAPLIGHLSNGSFAIDEEHPDAYTVSAPGQLFYLTVLMDYTGCMSNGIAYQGALDATARALTTPGSLTTIGAGECPGPWQTLDYEFTVGEPVDLLVSPNDLYDGWDWSSGGTAWTGEEALPAGLTAQVYGQDVDGVEPLIRITGTPTWPGTAELTVGAEDSAGFRAETVVTFHILPATQAVQLELGIEIGDVVDAAEVTVSGSGLLIGSPWDVTVRSTPVSIGAGMIAAGGLSETLTLPTGLESGWHSITFTGTWVDGRAATSMLWFEIDTAGRLLRVSPTAPAAAAPAALGTTGSDAAGSLGGFGLLLVLAGVLVLRRRVVDEFRGPRPEALGTS